MALQTCSECGEKVEAEASRVAEAERKASAEVERDQQEKEGSESTAKVMAQQILKQHLKYPDDAEFSTWGTDQTAGMTKSIDGQLPLRSPSTPSGKFVMVAASVPS